MSLDRPLKIAVFSDSALPILNGVSVSIDALTKELRARGHKVYVFTTRYPGFKDRDPNTYRFLSIRVPLFKDYPLSVPPFYPWVHAFRKHEFDLIHTHTPFTLGLVGLRWAQAHELPLVTTYHTHYDKYTHYIPLVPKRYLRYRLAKHTNFYYNSAEHVITPSEPSQRWLLRHSVRTPVSVIPTGVPRPKALDAEAMRGQLDFAAGEKIWLYVGRVAQEKNIGVLLEALKRALTEDPMVRLVIVGDGPARGEYTRMARELGIGDAVRFEGFVPRTEVDRYYAAADVFTFGSQTETQGLVVVEAMTYGLPAVVVRGGGASEPVVDGESGFLVGNDPMEIADRALTALATPERTEAMRRSARESSYDYTVGAMGDRVLDVYQKVLRMAPSAREGVRLG